MQDLVADHPADITKLLRGLVAKGLLGDRQPAALDALPAAGSDRAAARPVLGAGGEWGSGSPRTGRDSPPLPRQLLSFGHQQEGPGRRNGEDSTPKRGELKAISARVAGKGRTCVAGEDAGGHPRAMQGPLPDAGQTSPALLARKPENLRNKTLTPMIREGLLRFRHPEQPNHPDQAYTATAEAP